MDRRRFLTHLGAGGAGIAVGGLGAYELPRPRPTALLDPGRELADLATPGGPPARLRRSQLVWSVDTDKPYVALTFDDGPDPEFTPRILDVLDQYQVKATFNVMGYNAIHHADLLEAEVKAGHEIGNHTWTHRDLAFETADSTLVQLRRGREAIEQVAGVPIRFFRPPRGELTGTACRYAAELGYDILLWSATRGSYGFTQPRQVADYVVRTLVPGDILGLHDGIGRGTFNRSGPGARVLIEQRETEVRALPDLLERSLRRGIRFVPASILVENARSPGAAPSAGSTASSAPGGGGGAAGESSG
jgi:peptidoglycan/xylan/chitin deacetylase (PgdA/CDA1 family)